MRILQILLFVMCFAVMAGCAPQKPLTPEQLAMQEAQAPCTTSANDIAGPPYNSNNPAWDAYFTMCMTTPFGYTQDDLKQLRY